jgi:hypothetical protein
MNYRSCERSILEKWIPYADYAKFKIEFKNSRATHDSLCVSLVRLAHPGPRALVMAEGGPIGGGHGGGHAFLPSIRAPHASRPPWRT